MALPLPHERRYGVALCDWSRPHAGSGQKPGLPTKVRLPTTSGNPPKSELSAVQPRSGDHAVGVQTFRTPALAVLEFGEDEHPALDRDFEVVDPSLRPLELDPCPPQLVLR